MIRPACGSMAEVDERMMKLDRATAISTGFVDAGITLEPEPLLGVGKIQFLDGKDAAFFERAFGQAPPSAGTSLCLDRVVLSWLAPDQWLVTGSEPDVDAALERADIVAGDSALTTDLTHAHVSLLLSGEDARHKLAAVTPLDISGSGMRVGGVARAPLGDTNIFLARLADLNGEPSFRIIVDQTMAAYAVRMLSGSTSMSNGGPWPRPDSTVSSD
jgi:sarcosine oxidase subunit gamma